MKIINMDSNTLNNDYFHEYFIFDARMVSGSTTFGLLMFILIRPPSYLLLKYSLDKSNILTHTLYLVPNVPLLITFVMVE